MNDKGKHKWVKGAAWWWSTGQHARRLLRQFEFESPFSEKIVSEKRHKQKEAGF